MLETLVYVSSAAHSLDDDGLEAILTSARRNNLRSGVTGLLLHYDGNFLQALEGESGNVARTFARIEADTRHRGLLTLHRGPIERRGFAQWSMAYRRVDARRGVEGFAALTQESLAALIGPDIDRIVATLIDVFDAQTRRRTALA